MLGWVDSRPLSAVLPRAEARAFARDLGITTCGELLEYYPRSYSHHGGGVAAGPVQEGDVITFVGEVLEKRFYPLSKRRTMTRVKMSDGCGVYTVMFFNASLPNQQLVPGVRAIISGKVRFSFGQPHVMHPSYFVLPRRGGVGKQLAVGGLGKLAVYGGAEDVADLLGSLEWVPVYPAKKAVNSWRIIGAVNEVLRCTDIPEPLDFVPHGLVSMGEALRGVHQPDACGPDRYVARLKYNEALSLALVMALRRVDAAQRTAPSCRPCAGYQQQLFEVLPYALTEGQAKVLTEIAGDLSASVPMTRLLQGEVGSGKTVVSLAAMLQVVDAGRQCAMLAPTEVLVLQHARTLRNLLADIPVRVVVLTGAMSAAQKREALLDIVSGEADIVVGTHALIQDGVEFFDLALVVVDEQHRFGVEQRDTLRSRGREGVTPHVLVMTATPIPRTVAMTTFGDLAVSTLRELPGGRRPITSAVISEAQPVWIRRIWERIREELHLGHQAYVVCPRIDGEGGVLEMFEYLSTSQFVAYNVAFLHGRMAPEEKEQVMRDFARGDVDILVSTTVIEVGVDVPNATVMLIREAENFGVSQLHQLRGRVGRGEAQSYCLLHTGFAPGSPPYERLHAVASVDDGFEIAEIDLRYRHEGDVLGTAQSGVSRRMKLLSLLSDYEIIRQAFVDARDLVARNRPLAERLVSDLDLGVQDYLEKS